MNIDKFLTMLQNDFSSQRILAIGNGAPLHEEVLTGSLGDTLTIHPLQVAAAQQIGLMAYEKWLNKKEISTLIEPNYIKTQMFTVSR